MAGWRGGDGWGPSLRVSRVLPTGPCTGPLCRGKDTHSLSLCDAGEWGARFLPGRRPPWRAAACLPHWHPPGSPLRAPTSPEDKGRAPSQGCSLRPHVPSSQPLGDPQTHSLPHVLIFWFPTRPFTPYTQDTLRPLARPGLQGPPALPAHPHPTLLDVDPLP